MIRKALIGVLWSLCYDMRRFGDWLSAKACAACEALETAYVDLEDSE